MSGTRAQAVTEAILRGEELRIAWLVRYQLDGYAVSTDAIEADTVGAIHAAVAAKFYGTDPSKVTIVSIEGPFESANAVRRHRAEQRYTDAELTKDLNDPFPGPARAAVHLLKLDTLARRLRADDNATTAQNLMGGTYSHRVAESVAILLAMIAEGREEEETYPERTARELREREQAHQEVTRQALAARYAKR